MLFAKLPRLGRPEPPWCVHLGWLVVFFACVHPARADDAGDSFTNNLLTDLAPILALFGEQVTKQFISRSLTVYECILFASCPIGIMTAVVSAIRVAAPNSWKAIVGRAMESHAAAELEVLSSTSNEVCELWNGQGIVRVMGSPEVLELLYVDALKDKDNCGLFTLTEESFKTILEGEFPPELHDQRGYWMTFSDSKEEPEKSGAAPVQFAPNIALNLGTPSRERKPMLRFLAVLGVMVQLAAVVYGAMITYYPPWASVFTKDGEPVVSAAFPIMAVGTLMVAIGMFLCAAVVERSTDETTWTVREPGTTFRLLWLQKKKIVNDQTFGSCAIFAAGPRTAVLTSRPRGRDAGVPADGKGFGALYNHPSLPRAGVLVGVPMSIIGFALQFTGLRLLNWSATVAQLVGMVLMTALRVWIRLDLADRPANQPAPSDYELDWLALRLGREKEDLWPDGDDSRDSTALWVIDNRAIAANSLANTASDPANTADNPANPASSAANTTADSPPSDTDPISSWKARQRLGQLTQWRGRSREMAEAVCASIKCVLENLSIEKVEWSINGAWITGEESTRKDSPEGQQFGLEFTLCGGTGLWETKVVDEIEAALSLWEYSLSQARWFPDSTTPLRLLGLATEASRRDILWWGGIPAFSLLGLAERKTRKDEPEPEPEPRPEPEPEPAPEPEPYALGFQDIKEARAHQYQGGEWSEPKDSANMLRSMSCKSMSRDGPISCDKHYLTSRSPRQMGELLAQDLFLAFMFAAAKSIPKLIPEPTAIMSDSSPLTWQSFQLEHPKLQTMVQQIQQTGLATVGEAWNLIIPPLSLSGKLPAPSCVIERIREHARNSEIGGRWDQVREIYTDLVNICKTFDSKDSTYHKAAAAVVDVYRISKSTREVQEKQGRYGNDFNSLKGAENALKKMIDDLDPEVKSCLAKVYELEGRPVSFLDPWDPNQANSEFTVHSQSLSNIVKSRWRDMRYERRGEPDIFGWTLLHYLAAQPRRAYMGLQETILAGHDTRAMDMAEWTPLHYAADKGLELPVALLLQHGADIEGRGRDGMRPLHCAAKNGHDTVVKSLLEAGANEDVRDNSRSTPLHWASWGNHLNVVTVLLNKGADEAARDNYGRTALHLTAQAGDEEVVESLPEKGKDINAKDRARARNKELAESLLKKGGDINAKDRDGATALHLAVKAGNEEVVESLLENGGDVNAKDRYGATALHFAAQAGNKEVVERLLEKGKDINAKDRDGATAVQEETTTLHTDIDSKDNYDGTPLAWAIENGHEVAVKVLIKHKAELNYLYEPIVSKPNQFIRYSMGLVADLVYFGCYSL